MFLRFGCSNALTKFFSCIRSFQHEDVLTAEVLRDRKSRTFSLSIIGKNLVRNCLGELRQI